MLLSYFRYLPIIGFKFKGYTIFTEQLRDLHKKLMRDYLAYKEDEITQKEYLVRAKSLDRKIADLEMSNLLDTSVLKGSFLLHSQKQEYSKVSGCKTVSLSDPQ